MSSWVTCPTLGLLPSSSDFTIRREYGFRFNFFASYHKGDAPNLQRRVPYPEK